MTGRVLTAATVAAALAVAVILGASGCSRFVSATTGSSHSRGPQVSGAAADAATPRPAPPTLASIQADLDAAGAATAGADSDVAAATSSAQTDDSP